MSEPVQIISVPLGDDSDHYLASVILNKPSKANALDLDLIEGLTNIFDKIAAAENPPRAVVLSGAGRHFCAGADLQWMRSSAALSRIDNIAETKILHGMFEAIANCPVPTIACPHGAIYGGAVGLVACCDIVVAADSASFCLSEVKLGLLPAVILPFLLRKINHSSLKRLALTAMVFSAVDAHACGLVHTIASSAHWADAILIELNCLLQGGPQAHGSLKKLFDDLEPVRSGEAGPSFLETTSAAIADARTSAEGQEGLGAFFAKSAPSWRSSLTKWDLSHVRHS